MDKFFKISERGSNVKTEIVAGLTTFFAMAYILIVNPDQITGFKEYLSPIWNAVYIATIIAAVIGTLLYAFYAKLPFAQASGMGLNSFFFTSFVLPQLYINPELKIDMVKEGGDAVAGYQAGLVIILISGLIFLVLSVTGVREYIAKAMPECIKKSISAGIGLFIAFLGFQNVGIIQNNDFTLVQFVKINGANWVDIAPAIIALVGFLIIVILSKLNVKGSVLIGIVSTTVIYYVAMWKLPTFNFEQIGQSFKDFGNIAITGVFNGESWANAFSGEFVGGVFSAIMLIITFCIVDMFDTIGTLYGAAAEANMLDENGDPIDVDKAMMCDSVATVAGAVCGTSTCTTFVESAAGVAAGGRTGLASLVTSICFAVCLFLSPLASIVPGAATAPALIYVGVLMLKNFSAIDMNDLRSAVPAFLTLIMMPLTYSIANGIGIGSIAYVIITLCTGKYTKKDIGVTAIAILFLFKFIFGAI